MPLCANNTEGQDQKTPQTQLMFLIQMATILFALMCA